MIRLLARSALVLSLALAACGDDDDPTGPGAVTLLTSGTPVTNISGALNSQKVYRIPVAAGATRLTVTTAGGSGDVDILVRRGSPPTETSVDDCESLNFGNDDSCILTNPTAGDWFILLYGSEAYSGATLTATVTRP